MANTQAFCSQAKVDLMNGKHAFGASVIRAGTTKDDYYMALFLASASRGVADTVYNNTGELAASGNYTQGGKILTTANPPALDGTTAHFTPSASVSWTSFTSSGSFDCAVMYNNTSASKLEVAVFTFGAQSITSGTFTLSMPVDDGTTGLIRIA